MITDKLEYNVIKADVDKLYACQSQLFLSIKLLKRFIFSSLHKIFLGRSHRYILTIKVL